MTGDRPDRVRLPAQLDGRGVTAQIEREFPEVSAWYGRATGTWWAMVPVRTRWRLVEAISPVELRAAILNRAGWPWPPGRAAGRRP